MKNITLCLMACGEETEAECLEAVAPFRAQVVFQEVRNVCPQIAALNRMVEQAETPYLIPLDADIVLFPDAYERIRMAVDKYHHDPCWHSILFNLFDTLTEREILALKIFRTDVLKRHPFVDGPTPDVEHYRVLTEAGYRCIHTYLGRGAIGRHVVRGGHHCYHKYRDVYLTYRSYRREWDPGVFMGGETLLERSRNHFNYFLYKWVMTANRDYLACIAGMVDGLTATLDHRSKSLDLLPVVSEDRAIQEYYDWLLPQLDLLLF